MKTVELEQARCRLAELLAGPASGHEKLTRIVRFFKTVSPHFSADALRSYHLEFSTPFLKTAAAAALANRPPGFLLEALELIRVYRDRFAGDTAADDLEAAERACRLALLETSVVLGDWEQARGALEALSGERVAAEPAETVGSCLLYTSDAADEFR
ncbi:MAG: hypothetical protein QUS35_01435, partial [bacterium]|nr:hypothetical protein [bacterium]